MKDRIKKIRTDTRLSMEKFGEKIGITRSSVCKLESGENNPSEQTIKLICKEYKINKDWLLTGEGEMYDIPEDETAAIVSDMLEEENPFYDLILGIVKSYQKLDPKSQETLDGLIQMLLGNIKREG